jgi:hypothetical protein
MSIRPIGNAYGPVRPVAPAAPTAPADAEQARKPKVGGPPAHAPAHGYRARHDSVAISDGARALAAGAPAAGDAPSATPVAGPAAPAGAQAPAAAREAMSPERVADLRRKVLEGAYNQTAVVDQVARRLLETGEV